MSIAEPTARQGAKATIWIFMTLAATSCALTLLFLGMRSVMEIGGACAEGGPFVPRQPCPDGVPGLMIAGIWGGIIACGLYAWQALKYRIPNFLGLAWPALFLSLGWNFLEYGLDPPGEGGLVWGWLICAFLFGLMGGLPLIAVVPSTIRSFRSGTDVDLGPQRPLAALRPQFKRGVAAAQAASAAPTPTSSNPRESRLVGDLERLAELHRSGALSDDEYARAKRNLIEGAG